MNEYISRNTGVFQTFLCKRIVSEVYRGLITKELAILIFERIQWTEILGVLIRSFVCLSSHTKNVVLDSLSLVFKRHFDILNLHAMNSMNFLDFFTIKDIIRKCNCRKKYNAEFSQEGDIPKWYINGDVPTLYSESEVTYRNNNEIIFCEGRFWKNSYFLISTLEKSSEWWRLFLV